MNKVFWSEMDVKTHETALRIVGERFEPDEGASLAEDRGHWMKGFQFALAGPIYAGTNNPKGLASAIEVKLNHVTDENERLDLLREVASLYETRIRDAGRAFERYLAAFQLAPDNDQCQADAERVAQQTERWDDLIVAYRQAITNAENDGSPSTVSALRLRLGRVLVDEVKRVDDALSEYRAVYEAEPENTTALEALERLYRQTERWKELLEVYERRRELAYAPEERKPILFEIAQL